MRQLVACIFFVVVAPLVGCSPLSSKTQEMVGTRAPESRLMFFDGSEVPLSSYRGKDVSLLFWATWCKFSRGGIERYEALARKYSNRGDIEFIAVSVDKNEDFGVLKDRIKEQDLKTMTHIFSGNDSSDDAFVNLNGRHVPYVVFIDANGTIRFVDTDIDALEEYLMLRFGGGVGGAESSLGARSPLDERAAITVDGSAEEGSPQEGGAYREEPVQRTEPIAENYEGSAAEPS